jgi:hypothetical protein
MASTASFHIQQEAVRLFQAYLLACLEEITFLLMHQEAVISREIFMHGGVSWGYKLWLLIYYELETNARSHSHSSIDTRYPSLPVSWVYTVTPHSDDHS